MLIAFALAQAAPAWAPVAMNADHTTLYFVDRANLPSTADGREGWVYAVSASYALNLHYSFDCAGSRYRNLDVSEGAVDSDLVAVGWRAVKPNSPLSNALRYACSGGKLDLGFGDVAVNARSPVAFGRAFLTERAKQK